MERVFREEYDHRRAEQEAAHFIAFLEDDLLIVVAPFPNFADTRWVDGAMLDGGHAADDGRADQDQDEWAKPGLEDANDPLVAGEQSRYATCGRRIDRE